MVRRESEPYPSDILAFRPQSLVNLIRQVCGDALPEWCAQVSIKDYSDRKYDKIRADLRKLYQTYSSVWEVRRDEVVLRVMPAESFGLRKEIPDYLKKEGSKGGNIIMHCRALEDFLDVRFRRGWRIRLRW
ncbi:MAG: hypothetical protein IT323_08905 [Anaerolineae bacterium]|nr:hypothetical protein [Anaerolineae bacterium]